ncbi:MAG: AAA family ATPase [bacterium]
MCIGSLEKINNIKQNLNNYFIERQDIIDGIFLAIMTGKHMLLIGPPGVAKSYVLQAICEHIKGITYWEYLLTPSTKEEEIMGHWSVKEAARDRMVRNIENRLPEAHIAFGDEFFKAKGETLQSLLLAMSDKIYYNPTRQTIPLISFFGASNEKPGQGDSLEALYDRFLLRYELKRLKKKEERLRLYSIDRYEPNNISIHLDEILELQKQVKDISLPDGMKNLFADIIEELEYKNIVISERRQIWCLGLLKANAMMNGRDTVEREDFRCLIPALWTYSVEYRPVCITLNNFLREEK